MKQTNPCIYKIYNTLESLKEIGESWDALAEQSPHKNPIMTYTWLSVFFELRLSSNQTWFVIAAFDGEVLVGVLPVVATTKRVLGFTWVTLSLPADDQTMSVDMIIKEGFSPSLGHSMVQEAFKFEPKAYSLSFNRVDGLSPTYKAHQNNDSVLIDFCENGASLDAPKDFQLYRSSLAKNFKSNLNKASNKLKNLGASTFLINEDGNNFDQNLRKVIEVEGSGWKGLEKTAIGSSQDTQDFYKLLARRLAEKGWLSCHFLESGNDILAANFAVRFSGSMLLWKLGYNDTFKKMSPGNLLMEYLIENGSSSLMIDRIDLMTNEDWYNNWGMKWRPFYNYWVFRDNFVGRLVQFTKRSKLKLKKLKFLKTLKAKILK